ncbi:DUF29 domain-containing protein [Chroococcus sp. FPU101]|uniref:DUF29 domain-containing protein n=1 Tax=Chroococcus sp. FPU101 TaxID=1974212 RepID=UPI001A8D298E|nr:DUF29 domain-containing protein [Chroococcus sp. FPU101]GFE70563.1 hypothetical protein CFPU101_31730 [Chroococcus sp. FPU101]
MTTQLNYKTLYETDFVEWLETTTQLLRDGKLDQLDINNLVEELESMGRSEKRELRNCLTTIIEHLLKLSYWEAEKAENLRGWRNTIIEQRNQIERILEDSPSLKNLIPDFFPLCYQDARKLVIKKTGLANIPSSSPYTIEQVLDEDFLLD